MPRRHYLQEVFPDIGGFVRAVLAHWITCTLTIRQTLVEGHKESILSSQLGCKVHFVLVKGEVRQAAAIVQQRLTGAALLFVLLLAVILGRLVSPGILEFEGKEWQAVQEYHHIYLVSGIQQGEGLLPGN